MPVENGEIVVVTGGSGFIGQHLIKMLLEQADELNIMEIRSVDIVPYKNKIGHPETSMLRTFVADICDPDSLKHIFADADGVFHCAALVSLEYPPNYAELERVNVQGAQNIVRLCVEHNIKRLVYTSCASVNFAPYTGASTFSIIINQTEAKAPNPTFNAQNPQEYDKSFLIPGYASSKSRGEIHVLNCNGAELSDHSDVLATAAIRVPLVYGECDSHFMPKVFSYMSKNGYTYPRISGAGGKQQLIYAGNVAWGHICAYKTLRATPRIAIAGCPVFVTDDTPINDVSRFIQKMALMGKHFKVNSSLWYVPHLIFFLLAYLLDFFVKLLHPLSKYKLPYSLRAISSFTGSVIMFNRMRAEISMDYTPLFDSDTAMQRSARWYADWWEANLAPKRKNKAS